MLILTMVAKISQLLAILSLWCVAASATPMTRVVGGENADVGQFPYQVVLFKNDQFTCGGSIISPQYILTAAHCVVSGEGIETLPARYFTVRVGSIQRLGGGKVVKVEKIIVRPSYSHLLDDVALLKLTEQLQFTDNIDMIELYSGEVPSGQSVVISGWGRLSAGGQVANRLQYTTLTALDSDECDKAIGWGNEQIICLDHPEDYGACHGDSGGPATYRGKLVGVAGFVVGGCASNNPDGYAKVSYHREWILANIV